MITEVFNSCDMWAGIVNTEAAHRGLDRVALAGLWRKVAEPPEDYYLSFIVQLLRPKPLQVRAIAATSRVLSIMLTAIYHHWLLHVARRVTPTRPTSD